MRRLLAYLAWLLALGVIACCVSASAAGFQFRAGPDNGEPSTTGPYTLSGIVVDSVTSAPIRRALVQLYAGQERFALTDVEGKFRFENLPQGESNVSATKPGYSNGNGLSDSGVSVTLTIGPDAPQIILKLESESGITVQVTGEDSEPVEGLPVRVLSSRIVLGRRFWDASRRGNTDEDGNLRLSRLRPGKYYVSVGPSFRSLGSSNGADVGYPRVFYPNAADRQAAVPVDVVPGKNARVEFSLTSAPLYRISGSVVGGPIGETCLVGIKDAAGEEMAIGVTTNPRTGEFRSGQIPAGLYMLTARYVAGGKFSFAGSVTIQVDSNLAKVTLPVAPAVSIPVVFRFETAAAAQDADDTPGMVWLMPKQQTPGSRMVMSGVEGSGDARRVVLNGVEHGTYSVNIRLDGLWYAESARYGSTDLLLDDMTVAEGGSGEAIEITVRDDGARLSGNVRESGTGAPAKGTVLLVPERSPRRVIGAPILNGTFSRRDLAPGSYRVIALDHVDELEYTNPEVLQEYLSKAQEVTLSPKQDARMDLEQVRRGK